MQDTHAELLAQLRDIRGFDPFPWWPLAPGWWYLLFLLIFCAVSYAVIRRFLVIRKNARLWKEEAQAVLSEIRVDMRKADKEKLASLSILLRKLAIRQHGRDVCAGLEGRAWLLWLSRNDPSGFDWERDGRLLIEAPYAPEEQRGQRGALEQLIKAVEGWVR